MLVRLLSPNVVRGAFPRSSAFGLRFQMSGWFGNIGSSFPSVSVNAKQSGGCVLRFFPAAIGQFSCARQYHKLHVQNLPKMTTEKKLHKHFSQFGMLLSVYIVRDEDTRESLGRGYVVFADKEASDYALSYHPQVVDNRPIEIRPVDEISFVVHGLSPSTTLESLQAYFSCFGKLFTCNVERHPVKGNSGFLHFCANSDIEQELTSKVHVLDGKQVNVKQIFPRELTQYVGNLSPSTTDEMLTAYYSKFGRVLQAEVIKNKWTGQSRGFGYVTFSSHQELDSALRAFPHIIDGRRVKIDYRTREFSLFVAELGPHTSEDSLRQYFEQFGPVYECKIDRDKQTNQLRDFGWVTFSSEQGLNTALGARPLVIDGKVVDVTPSNSTVSKCTLFVAQLLPSTTEQMLYNVFSKFGSLVSCRVKYDKVSGRSRGFGFVTYSNACDAMLVRPHVVDGRVVRVVPEYRGSKLKNALSSPTHEHDCYG